VGNWGDWDPGVHYWANWVSEPSCWRIHLVNMYIPIYIHIFIHFFSLVNFHSVQMESVVGWGCWHFLCSCECSVCWPCVYVYPGGVNVCSVCVCAHWEYIFSLATGWAWGHVAASTSPHSGCKIQQDVFTCDVKVCPNELFFSL